MGQYQNKKIGKRGKTLWGYGTIPFFLVFRGRNFEILEYKGSFNTCQLKKFHVKNKTFQKILKFSFTVSCPLNFHFLFEILTIPAENIIKAAKVPWHYSMGLGPSSCIGQRIWDHSNVSFSSHFIPCHLFTIPILKYYSLKYWNWELYLVVLWQLYQYIKILWLVWNM